MRVARLVDEPEIPTSSMADIAFLLIVFFMLTTVFSANKGMEHLLPLAQTEVQLMEPEDAIYVKVLSNDRFSVDGEEYAMIDAAHLYRYVMGKIQVNPKKPVILHTEANVPYGAMICLLDQLKLVDSHTPGVDLSVTIPSKSERARYGQ